MIQEKEGVSKIYLPPMSGSAIPATTKLFQGQTVKEKFVQGRRLFVYHHQV
jgi:hypothetical protein